MKGEPWTREPSEAWWLLALGGVLDAMHAARNLLMMNPDGAFSVRAFALHNAVRDMGVLALAAGACAVAALVRGPLSFRPVSLLFAVMAVSIGVSTSRTSS